MRRSRERQGALALALSVCAHLIVLLALSRAPKPPPPSVASPRRLEVEVVTTPAPSISLPPGDEGAGVGAGPPRLGAGTPPPRRAAPDAETPPLRSMLSMRPLPGSAEETRRVEVPIPAPDALGGIDTIHAPPETDLPALRPWIRAPKPLVPGEGPGPLGPEWQRERDGRYTRKRPGFDVSVTRDGRIRFKDRTFGDIRVGYDAKGNPYVAIPMDLTDLIMRAAGMDPYVAGKYKILEETREARAEMARGERGDDLRTAVIRLPRLLHAVWENPSWDAVTRRRILFELWDECVEDGDEEVVRAVRAVRAGIYGFIRRELPAGSPEAYGAGELDQLNAGRRSTARFDPYAR